MLSCQNKTITYLRTRHGKIIWCQRPIIHIMKIVLRGTTPMLLKEIVSFFVDLIGSEKHTLKEANWVHWGSVLTHL